MMKITQWILRKILTNWMITTMVRRRKEHECTKKLSNLDENCLRRQLAQACEENARLQTIVDKLPKTGDGVPVVSGDKVYVLADGVIHSMVVEGSGQTARGPTYSHVTYHCYSTREAAREAARGPRPGRSEAG